MPDRQRHRHRGWGAGVAWKLNAPVQQRSNADFRVALAGNPNAGKTSLFNAITGQHQHIGNYPGVTVEKKIGRIERDGVTVEIVDLPGTYSLSAYSIEEVVARDFVIKERPDLIVDVLDSTNLERNLYLLLQFQELGIPVLGVLNMSDEAEAQGLNIDEVQLGKLLGIPLVKTVGTSGRGVDELVNMLLAASRGEIELNGRRVNYGRDIERLREQLVQTLSTDLPFSMSINLDWLAIKLLEQDEDAIAKVESAHAKPKKVLKHAEQLRDRIRQTFEEEAPVVVAEQRYAYIHGAVKETVTREDSHSRIDVTEAVDKILLNRYAGLFIFFAVMYGIYQVTFTLGNPISDLIDSGFSSLAGWLAATLPPGILTELLVDGIIGGVGGVLVFLPLVVFLFLGLSLLEDSGYMARAAFVMDHIFHIFGLHGRSFVPFMIATGCAVPAVMSARTLVNPRDRIITVLVAPMLMCGAKSPVIAMLAAAFFPHLSGLIFWLVWLAGWLIAFTAALVMRLTIFRSETTPFVMELPPYRRPTVRGALSHMWERSWMYLKKAGTFILATSIVVWFLLAFPRLEQAEPTAPVSTMDETVMVADGGEVVSDAEPKATQQVQQSYAGRLGRFVAPVMEPVGYDWKLNIALLSGFAAKEVFIATMGIVYGVGEADADAESSTEPTPLKQRLTRDGEYSRATALSLMMFMLLYVPCMSVMAVVWKELGSWKWTVFLAGYTFALAWGLAFVTYNVSLWLGLGL